MNRPPIYRDGVAESHVLKCRALLPIKLGIRKRDQCAYINHLRPRKIRPLRYRCLDRPSRFALLVLACRRRLYATRCDKDHGSAILDASSQRIDSKHSSIPVLFAVI